MLTLTGRGETTEIALPAGAAYVDMRQPLARLVPVLREPASTDSLAACGFFSPGLVRQWSLEPGVYPVVRVAQRPPAPFLVATEARPYPPARRSNSLARA